MWDDIDMVADPLVLVLQHQNIGENDMMNKISPYLMKQPPDYRVIPVEENETNL